MPKLSTRIEGQFSYLNPAEWFEKQSDKRGLFPNGWFVISHQWVLGKDSKQKRRRPYGRLFAIESEQARIFRAIRFSPVLKGGAKAGNGEIVLDWGGWLALTGFPTEDINSISLKIRPAKWWEEVFCAGPSHPDPAVRQASLIAVVACGLGVLSVILAVLGWIT
jgi:hypothetical protein